jgi:death on curing protein
VKEPLFLRLEEVIEIHNDQIKRYGGRSGIRDLELLKSALAMPEAGMGGEYLHADIYAMAAAYLFHIVRNHPFLDGNKRTGAVSAIIFLMLNGIELEADENNFEKMVVSVAEAKTGKAAIARYLRKKAHKNE